MPASISDLRAGLADAISALAGVRVYETIPDAPIAPAAIVELRGINYDSTFARGSDEYRFAVTLVSGRADDRTAQTRLEGWAQGHGLGSFKTAVEADPTLGGICGAVRVEAATGLVSLEVNNTPHLAIEFAITLYA